MRCQGSVNCDRRCASFTCFRVRDLHLSMNDFTISGITLDADGIIPTFCFKLIKQCREGEGRIAPKPASDD